MAWYIPLLAVVSAANALMMLSQPKWEPFGLVIAVLMPFVAAIFAVL